MSKSMPLGLRLRLWWLLIWRKNVLVTTHVRPDGDAMGSALALFLFLRACGKNARVILDEVPDGKYDFLMSSKFVESCDASPSFSGDEVVFVLDSGSLDRTGRVASMVMPSHSVVNIDHHKDNVFFGAVNWVDARASSVGEMLLRWFGRRVNGEMAQALLLSLATDTGFFRFSNATPVVLRLVAFLLERGADQTIIHERIYQNRPFQFLQLVARFLARIEMYQDGKLAVSYVSFEDMSETDCYETDGLLEYLGLIRGVEVYIVLKEREKNTVSVSFRTKTGHDMSVWAHEFGGGGHAKAAGCVVDGDILEIQKTIVDVALRHMEKA